MTDFIKIQDSANLTVYVSKAHVVYVDRCGGVATSARLHLSGGQTIDVKQNLKEVLEQLRKED